MRKRRIQAPPGMSGCTKCGAVKPLSAFSMRGPHLHSWCRDCVNAGRKRYRMEVLRVMSPPKPGSTTDEFRREPTASERANFDAKVRKDIMGTGCWEWAASVRFPTDSGHGRRLYGAFWFDGKVRYAHRVAWHFNGGQQPTGLVLDHVCMNGRCVNPDHLRVVTVSVNMRENTIRSRKAA